MISHVTTVEYEPTTVSEADSGLLMCKFYTNS